MAESPAGPLVREHYLIKRVIADMALTLEEVRETSRVDPHYVMTVTDFIRTYADACHHGKEEDILFRELDAKPMSPEDRAEMEELIYEHRRARAMTRDLIDANERYERGDDSTPDRVAECLGRLVDFYPAHILKEDRHFFGAAMTYLDESEQTRMLEEFEEFEKELLHHKYEELVRSMEEKRSASPAAAAIR